MEKIITENEEILKTIKRKNYTIIIPKQTKFNEIEGLYKKVAEILCKQSITEV